MRPNREKLVLAKLLQRCIIHLRPPLLLANKSGVNKHRRWKISLLQNRPGEIIKALIIIIKSQNNRLLRDICTRGQMCIQIIKRYWSHALRLYLSHDRLKLLHRAVIPKRSLPSLLHQIVEHQNRHALLLSFKNNICFAGHFPVLSVLFNRLRTDFWLSNFIGCLPLHQSAPTAQQAEGKKGCN